MFFVGIFVLLLVNKRMLEICARDDISKCILCFCLHVCVFVCWCELVRYIAVEEEDDIL